MSFTTFLSSFRKVFLSAIRDLCEHDGTVVADEKGVGSSSRSLGLKRKPPSGQLGGGRGRPGLARASAHQDLEINMNSSVGAFADSFAQNNESFNTEGANSFEDGSLEVSSSHSALGNTLSNHSGHAGIAKATLNRNSTAPNSTRASFTMGRGNRGGASLSSSLHNPASLSRSIHAGGGGDPGMSQKGPNRRDSHNLMANTSHGNPRMSITGPIGPLAGNMRKNLMRSSLRKSRRGTGKSGIISEDDNESVDGNARDVPYFEKLCEICEEIDYPYEYADIVGSQFLGLDGASPVTHIEGHVPTINELVEFLSMAFICITNFSDLSLIFVDDFQWVDSFTWKIFRELCERGKKMLLICAMRSHDKQALRRLSTAITQSHMQSQMIEISLGPLDLLEIREMIAKVLGYDEEAVDESLCSDIYQKTGGLPVYVAELLENIKRNKTVAIDDNGILRWTAQAEQEQVRFSFRLDTVVTHFGQAHNHFVFCFLSCRRESLPSIIVVQLWRKHS